MIKIKIASVEDAFKIADIYNGWAEFKGILPDKLCEPDKPEDIEQSIKNGRRYFIAENDGEPVGVNYIDTTDEYFECIRLGDLIVKKNFRNNGIGSALIDKVIEYAKKHGVRKIWLWTQEEFVDAIRLYEKKGFVFEGKQKAQFCSKDALLYGLVLD